MSLKQRKYGKIYHFLHTRGAKNLITVLILVAMGIAIQIWGKEYYQMGKCLNCSKNLHDLEMAKEAYRKEHPGAKGVVTPLTILKYMGDLGLPNCPYGVSYIDLNNLDTVTTCPLNGNPKFEPNIPGKPILYNGLMDLGDPEQRDALNFVVKKIKNLNPFAPKIKPVESNAIETPDDPTIKKEKTTLFN